MSQAPLVAWLAVRELWISFRLLGMLAPFVVAGAIVALVPAAPGTPLERLAVGLALATVAAAILAAWSLARERISGRAGWLVTRSVARGSFLLGWFVALTAVALAAMAAGATLGWMVVAPALADPAELMAALGASSAAVVAALALGTLAGALLRPRPAAGLAAVVSLLVALAAVLSPEAVPVPLVLLPAVPAAGSILPDAVRFGGVSLLVAAALVVVARVVIERAEL